MEHEFWHKKWRQNEIGFHEEQYNPGLVNHLAKLHLAPGSRILVPLCGKTLDIRYLMEQGYKVVGAELSELAVKQLFESLNITPMVEDRSCGKLYTAQGIQVFVGDLFTLQDQDLSQIDAIYDRAALVALPEDLRAKYTTHLRQITHHAPQLLICFDYDQSQMPGPPFSVNAEEVRHHYKAHYKLELVQQSEVKGGLKGRCPATTNIWALSLNTLV